ncbi:transcription factor cmr1 protein [Penicillium capsulatum]|uniref:Transcription factor cmr1 protein n=1 Tax=Penicillium capsulatum TaxID=69766 RepID=A0A9W9IH84_9EURO|nr:transcription factor cmr1 protein [Penicillium capsulatum]
MTNADKFFEIVNAKDGADMTAIEALFDQLDALPSDAMVGRWKGTSFDATHPAHQLLKDAKWFGKNMHSVDDVDPVIITDDQGNQVVCSDYGKARLREVVFRGVPTASMIYDILPIIDSFRRVSDEVVLGAMDNRDLNVHGTFYFYLTRIRD